MVPFFFADSNGLVDREIYSRNRRWYNLDTNIDRTIGARAMDTIVLAHRNLAELFISRSSVFKAQGQNTGAAWETIPNLGSDVFVPEDTTIG